MYRKDVAHIPRWKKVRTKGDVTGAINDQQSVTIALAMNNFLYSGYTKNISTGDEYFKNYQGSGFIDEMNAGMKISGCKLLLAVRTSRFEVKITQPDIMDASKVNVLPKVEEPTVSKKNVEYATYNLRWHVYGNRMHSISRCR